MTDNYSVTIYDRNSNWYYWVKATSEDEAEFLASKRHQAEVGTDVALIFARKWNLY